MHGSRIAVAATLLAIVVLSVHARADVESRAGVASTPDAQAAKPLATGAVECALAADRSFSGRLVSRSGRPVAGAQVLLLTSGLKAVATKTDRDGRFVFHRLRTAGYVLRVGTQSLQVRIWDAHIAPPSAREQLLLVSDGDVIRAQYEAGWQSDECVSCEPPYPGHFGGVFQRILCNPWIVGAGTAAAIAVPLGTDDDDAS